MTIDDTSRRLDGIDGDDEDMGSIDKVYQNYMMPGLELYDAKVTINHWQLRDCIKPSSQNPFKLHYIYDHSIRALDIDLETLRSYRHRKSDSGDRKRALKKPNLEGKHERQKLLRGNLNVPSQKLVEFYFKPRCFTELNGLTACGGLVGSDDKGFPTNWNRLSHGNDNNNSNMNHNNLNDNNNDDNNNNNNGVSTPAQPIKLASRDVLMDHSNYSNPNIWKGILSLYNENTKASMTFVLGQFINNCVTLHDKSNNQYDLYTCNNDGHMYQCDISNRDVQLVRRFSDLKFPLNNAAMSHDGKSMIVSGDSNKFAIYKQDELTDQFTLNYDNQAQWGSSHKRTKKVYRYSSSDTTGYLDNIFEAPNGDHGFYNSFSENDLQFATLFQNGVCLIYDVRRMDTPLAEISSTRPHSHNGAFRVCRFSYGLDDLLFISEHQGRVHVVDTRNFVNHQVILIPDKVTPVTDPEEDNPYLPHTMQQPISQRQRMDYQSMVFSPSYQMARRRYSFPTMASKNWEPWITPAGSIPLQYLEPKILPFPKVIDKLTNESVISRYTGGSTINNSHYQDQSSDGSNRVSKRRDSRTSFRIRRVSTSSKRPVVHEFTHQSSTANTNSSHSQNVSNSSTTATSSGGTSAIFDDDDLYDAYQDVNTNDSMYPLSGRFEPTITDNGRYNPINNTVVDYSSADFTEENNISGIDWVEDRNGSSLIIGTDYGIMRWNINSWARRSFSSYDFC
ncbi:Uncharacterized protein RNJ44_04210 [Nakaseomyces bracarensis]|uniref:DUF2415 domain-containing protein n=1 Tax=Nakaseomyces bracarensis TaxID=273131 RepID=A0ABR4NU78_9SACH